MRYLVACRHGAIIAVLASVAGCASYSRGAELATHPVVPTANEVLALDQLIVLVDVTGSMSGTKFRNERELLDAFTAAMPEGPYEAGINSFSGVSSEEWVGCGLTPYVRAQFEYCEQQVVLLGSLTPLSTAIHMLTHEMRGKHGNGALLVFSDGIVRNDSAVMRACEAMQAAHHGNLCIYTVQIGTNAAGGELLQAMSASTGCGKMWNGIDLSSNPAIEDMVRTIFFGERPVAAAPAAPAPAARREITLLGDVLFDFDKDILKPEGKLEVNKVIALLNEYPDRSIEITGHTCDLGSDAYNMDLSQRRANSVREYSVSQGIQPDRITTRAYGETTPAVPNTSEENRKLNRRITFVQ